MARLTQSLDGAVSIASAGSKPPGVALVAHRLILAGGVQGLGVRPAIYRLATRLELNGSVRNTSRGVEIEIEGPRDRVRRFERLLPTSLPAAASLTKLQSERFSPKGQHGFTIIKESPNGPLAARVPTDRGLCPDCSREITSPDDRRQKYPFTSCTQCGPRYTVIRSMPFERADTTMAEFALCDDCRHEYERPGDRRFHAQTTACGTCGPEIWCMTGDDRLPGARGHSGYNPTTEGGWDCRRARRRRLPTFG